MVPTRDRRRISAAKDHARAAAPLSLRKTDAALRMLEDLLASELALAHCVAPSRSTKGCFTGPVGTMRLVRRRSRHVRTAGLSSREAADLIECPSQRVQCVVGAGLDCAGRHAESLRGLRCGCAAEVAFEQYLPVLGRQGA
jgi:hypothetical protein